VIVTSVLLRGSPMSFRGLLMMLGVSFPIALKRGSPKRETDLKA
jgi:hypothetical protein